MALAKLTCNGISNVGDIGKVSGVGDTKATHSMSMTPLLHVCMRKSTIGLALSTTCTCTRMNTHSATLFGS